MERLIAVVSEYHLDFDDAYQYVAAERNEVPLISFDTAFDRTELGRLTSQEAILRQVVQE